MKHQVDPNKPKPDITDACSCTSCDSTGCFAYRQNKCCSCGQCNDPKTSNINESKKIDVNMSHSNSSDCIGTIKKSISKDCCAKMNAAELTMDKSKYADLENRLKEKLEKLYKIDNEIWEPAAVEQVAAKDKELDCVGTKLSAQIMNLSYKDYKQTLSYNRSDTTTFKIGKLSKYDIFQKIKEAYKACSCKVCECLVGKAMRNDACNCKPCECSDCVSYMENIKRSESSGTLKDCCGCKQYEKTFVEVARKMNDNNRICSCKPCDCIECAAEYLIKPCDCAPCQCVECKSMYILKQAPVIVAPVVDHSQRNFCQCSPCECIECGHRYGLPSNLMHEMATGTNKQRPAQCHCEVCQNEACEPNGMGSCKCDRRSRVMRKPVERDAQDYDIRTVLVNNHPIPKHSKQDTIAMFAALSNNYPNFTPENTKQCKCDECLVCSYKEDAINAIKSSQLFTPVKLQREKSGLNTDARKCQQWECEICYKYNGRRTERQKHCLYDVCDCIDCRRQKAVSTTKQFNKSEHNCRLRHVCEDNWAIVKPGRQPLHIKCMICKRCLRDDNFSSELGDTTKSVSTTQKTSLSFRDSQCNIKSQQESLCIYHAFPTLDFPQKSYAAKTKTPSYGTIRQASMSGFKRKQIKYPKTCNILKCDAYTQYKKPSKGLYKSNSMEYNYSSDSSSKTYSKSSSYYKENGSGTPASGHKEKSSESSCNSSGYDYPDYLVKFPKSTVETCLKDVMKLNLDKNIKLDKLKIAPSSLTRKRCVNNTSCENTISGKQGCKENRKYTKYYKTIDAKHSSHRRLKRKTHKTEDTYTPLQRSYSKKLATCKKRQPCCSLDMTMDKPNITINTPTQTEGLGDQESQTSTKIDDGRMRYERTCERETENRGNLQTSKNIKDFHISRNVYDYSVMNHRAPNIIQNDQCQWKCSHTLPFKYFSNTIDFFKIDEDYKRIQNTLREAKVFSSDLMKILEKYEKDNREFVSVSEKLKHTSMFNTNKNKEMYNVKHSIGKSQYKNKYLNETEHELRQIHLENPSTEEKISLQVFPKTIVCDRSQEENTIIQQTLDMTNFKHVNTNDRLIMVIVPQDNSNLKAKSITARNSKTKKENELQNQGVIEAVKDLNIHNSHASKTYKRKHRNYNKLMKRAVLVSKKIRVKSNDKKCPKPPVISTTTVTCNTSASQTAVKDNTTILASVNTAAAGQLIKINEVTDLKKNELNRVKRKLDTVFGSNAETSVCTSIGKMDQMSERIDALEGLTTMQTQEIEGRKPWPILKKNFSLVPNESAKSKGVHILPSVAQDVKEAVQSITLQMKDKAEPTSYVDRLQSQHEDTHPENNIEALDVGKVLDVPIQQEHVKDESDVRKETSNIRRKSKLELELKDPPKAISLQTSLQRMDNTNKENCDHLIYSTRDDIERQIKDLLNLKLLQPIMKKLLNSDLLSVFDTDNDLPRIESSKSSCEALKASFLGVRRVSDHTVLVKWNLPREVTDVQGYELLVDGRAVQKIFSPSKCMAVITCLPHTDKILLTIRTITAMVALTGHYPAASIVYHPRIK